MRQAHVLHRAALACAALLAASSCIARERVGGPCSYLKHSGFAEVVSVSSGRYRLKFRMTDRPKTADDALLMRVDGGEFEAEGGAVLGTRFYAQASVISRGTCTPVIYEIGGLCRAGTYGCGD